ncbi:response regulator [Larkinella soli]|uniref:response regulator n=1 Tax=Larkinella soli TaxID=1770527 RepID=UPI000FFC3DC6|nr:response regulator [Larkinella soli]
MTLPYQIYLAEDDEEDIEIFENIIKQHYPDSQITVFRNGQELLDALKSSPVVPSFIFLDINMPVLNGVEALVEIRALPQTVNTPTIMLTSSDFSDEVARCLSLGANMYLVKPSRLRDYHNLIRIFKINWDNVATRQERPMNSPE